ncbi:MAG: MATE family efflux transporter [Beduini sp.]|uniref:MATE family efflux transporter n=1 Tax=Beduini sp. TaxID=1922300 RepID=UPI0011C8C43F
MQEALANKKIPQLLYSLALPAICAQIVSLLYNVVDRIYIGRLPDSALAMAAIGLCVPLTTIIDAFTGLFGRGGAPLSSILLGKGEIEEADYILSNSFIALIVTSVVITGGVALFQEPLLYLFGASQETIGYARSYISVYSIGTIFSQLTVGLNYFINTQGFTKYGMKTVMIGAFLNIILDPFFIFVLDMGVQGAAFATVLSQCASCLWVLKFFFGKKTILHIKRKYLKIKWSILKQILMLGSAPFFMSASEGLLTISFNQQLLRYGGNLAVSSMTIMISMFNFLLLPIEGLAQGSQPIISFNYGAKNDERVRHTISLAFKVTLVYSVLGTLSMELFPHSFVGLFTRDPQLLELGSRMLRVYVFGCFILGANSTCQQTYNSLGDGKKSFFFAFYRKIILLIPLIFILPSLLPNALMAVILAEPISDIVTTFTNVIYFKTFIKRKLNLPAV